jgi:hypothetical protein
MAITEGAQIRQMPPHVEPNLVVLRHIVSAFVRGGRFARNGVHWSDVMEGHHDDELRPALPHLAMLLDVLAGARDVCRRGTSTMRIGRLISSAATRTTSGTC